MNPEFVYYFVFGSNLSFDRFHYYIKGGIYPVTGRAHRGCRDKNYYFDPNVPIQHIAKNLRMFFGNASSLWNHQGVAFVEEAPGQEVYGRLYKVTIEQFFDIQSQEGLHPWWYQRMIKESDLGYYQGIPIWTMTCSQGINSENEPSDLYVEIIKKGMEETGYPNEKISAFLITKLKQKSF